MKFIHRRSLITRKAEIKVMIGFLIMIMTFCLFLKECFGSNVGFRDTNVKVRRNAKNCISYTIGFPAPEFKELSESQRKYLIFKDKKNVKQVVVNGCNLCGKEGRPIIPIKPIKLVLPPGKDVKNITISYVGEGRIYQDVILPYGSRQIPICKAEEYALNKESILPLSDIYNRDSYYPAKTLLPYKTLLKNGFAVLITGVSPVQYNPARERIRYFKGLNIRFYLKENRDPNRHKYFRGKESDIGRLKAMVDNPEEVEDYLRYSGKELGDNKENTEGTIKYVIITKEGFMPYFQPLIDDKISRGVPAKCVSIEWIYANYSGLRPDGSEDNQTRIRNFIADYYLNYGTEYVLLGGDSDKYNIGGESEDQIVPVRYLEGRYGKQELPSDIYYSCLDKTFDADMDGIYGEEEDEPEIDLLAEVAVGRVPCDNKLEIWNFVIKSLNAFTKNNYRRALFVGQKLADGCWGKSYQEEIKLGSSTNGYNTSGFSPEWETETLYDYDWSNLSDGWGINTLLLYLNRESENNPVSIISLMGHGGLTYFMKLEKNCPDLRLFYNHEYYFIYSQACLVGRFDNYRGIAPMDEDCIGENFIVNDHGSFALVANSGFGFFDPDGGTDSASQYFAREFFDAYFGEGIDKLGLMNNDSKEDLIWYTIIEEKGLDCYFELNLLGDPEISFGKIQTGYPHLQVITPEVYYTHGIYIDSIKQPYIKSLWFEILNKREDLQLLDWEINIEFIKGSSTEWLKMIEYPPGDGGYSCGNNSSPEIKEKYSGSGPYIGWYYIDTNGLSNGVYEAIIRFRDVTHDVVFAERSIVLYIGTIIEDGELPSVLSLGESPYIITTQAHPSSTNTTIEAGVEIYFANKSGIFLNNENLYANGTVEQPILFTSTAGSLYNDGWKEGIRSKVKYGSSEIILNNCIIERIKNDTPFTGQNIYAEGYLSIQNCTIRNCRNYSSFLLSSISGTAEIYKSIFYNNHIASFIINGNGEIASCTFVHNNHINFSGTKINIKNSIIYENINNSLFPDVINPNFLPTVTYSDIQQDVSGAGNINKDPLFVDSANNNYNLKTGSPCIDAGDPSGDLDPDGTCIDMGSFYFDQ